MNGVYDMKNQINLLSLSVATIVLVGCNATVPSSAYSFSSAPADPMDPVIANMQTSRAKRTEYECRVSTEVESKPFPVGLDDFRFGTAGLYGYVDLYGDGTLEVISGFSDSTWNTSPTDPLYYGNKKRAREGEDYMMFSPNPNTVMPDGFKFITARHIIPSDLNNDGIDDIVVINQGPDQKPYVDQSNYVFLSSPTGYSKQRLPGPTAVWHGGAIGDIDNDGDLDIVATPSEHNRIGVYWNNGDNNFSFSTVIGASGTWNTNERFYNAQLWDIDKDGFLDLFVDGHKELASIFWGNGRGFNSKPTRIEALDAHLMEDVLFTDIDNDGVEEIVVLTSNQDPSKPATDDNNYYYGWGIYVVETEGRKVIRAETLYETGGQFLPYFTACDLKNDGDMDIIINILGQVGSKYNTSTTGMYVFENDNNKLHFNKLVSPKFYEHMMDEGNVREYITDELKKGEELGVELNGYKPTQVYYPTPENNKRYLKGEPVPANMLLRGIYYD